MKLMSASFGAEQSIPAQFAFGEHDPILRMQLSANHNPQLQWADVPAGTRSFALICVDPDAPSVADDANKEGCTIAASLPRTNFYHWVMVDIPASVREIAAGSCSNGIVAGGKKELPGPKGARQGVNDYTKWLANDPDLSGTYRGYDGPCPPWNDLRAHRYQFTLFALSVERCAVDDDFTAPQVLAAIKPVTLAEAQLAGVYAINPDVAKK